MLTGRLEQRRLPEDEGHRTAWRGVIVDDLGARTDESCGCPGRVGCRRRGEDERRLCTVCPRDAPQAPQHERDVRAEHPAVAVAFVDDHEAQSAQEGRPLLVAGQDPVMEHVGIGDDDVRVCSKPPPLLARGVPVVGGGTHPGQPERRDRRELIVGECLGRGYVEDGRAARGCLCGLEDGREGGHEVGE